MAIKVTFKHIILNERYHHYFPSMPWVSKGKDKHHSTCKVFQTNSLKLSNY